MTKSLMKKNTVKGRKAVTGDGKGIRNAISHCIRQFFLF